MNGVSAGPQAEPRAPGVAACAAGLAGFAVVVGVAGRFISLEALLRGGWGPKAAAVVAAAALATAVFATRRFLLRTLTSLPFAVAILTLILLATMLGTFVLQGATPAEYTRKYGSALAPILLKLGLDDIFHSLWFTGWLLLLGHSLGLVIIRKRAWRPPLWGHGLSHLGIILILVGGLIWSRWGMRGHIDLHEGRSVNEVVPSARTVPAPKPRPFGFDLRLEDFDIEFYPPEYRVYVYERSGESYRALKSFKLKEAADWKPAGSSGAEFRVVREFPDLRLRAEIEEAPAGEGAPAFQVETETQGQAKRIHLFAGVPGRDAVDLAPRGGPLLRLAWEPPPDAEVARWTETRPERHVLAAGAAEIEVSPGRTDAVALGEWRIKILGYYPDFIVDLETRQASTRSPHPNNPALQVAVSPAGGGPEEKRWLFAKMPGFGHEGETPKPGPRLVYRHERAHVPAPREVLVVGKAAEAWEIENGRVLRKSPLAPGGGPLPGVPGARARLFASARESHVPENRSPEWRNPAVEIEMRRGEETQSHLLKAVHGDPVHLPDGKTAIVFEPKPDDVKAYRSRLAVLEGDRKVLEKTIEVNDPLSYGGFVFYQSNYRKEDPTYSGILVVKDPGLPLVWIGFVMIGLGVIYLYYVRPRLWRRTPDGRAR